MSFLNIACRTRRVCPVLALTYLLILPGVASGDTAASIYRALDLRSKVAQGEWRIADVDARRIPRQETDGGRWALEVLRLGGAQEAFAEVKLLDSSQTLLWSGVTSANVRLSQTSPAFLSFSRLGPPNLRLYNLEISADPVFQLDGYSVSRVCQSFDGRTFGVLAGGRLLALSISGEVLIDVPQPDSTAVMAIAIADHGQYVAYAFSRYASDSKRYTKKAPKSSSKPDGQTPFEVLRARGLVGSPPSRSTKSTGHSDRGRSLPPRYDLGSTLPGLPMVASSYHIGIISRSGTRVSEFSFPRRWTTPHRVVLSKDAPPSVGVATSMGVSLWSDDGSLLWEDSAAFMGPNEGLLVQAVHMIDDGRLFVTTSRRGESLFWCWNSEGTLETSLQLPREFEAGHSGARFYNLQESSICIQSFGETITVQWQDSGE